jgi:anti-sigma regulatory factor (Ser/Thr protein kinase)
MAGITNHRRAFAPTPESVRAVRAFVRSELDEFRLQEEDVTLLASELATNAVLHAVTNYEVVVHISADAVRVEVSDLDAKLPQARLAPDGAMDGRGMTIVAALARRWGVEARPHGKVVWFETLPVRAA